MIGNLGAYQIMTTWAKKVGGPVNLLLLVLGAGGLGGGAAVYTGRDKIESFLNRIKQITGLGARKGALEVQEYKYKCTSDCKISKELTLKCGDRFAVLWKDEDKALICVEGASKNPYFVSKAPLEKASDFEDEDKQ